MAVCGLQQRLIDTFKTRGGFGLFELYFQRSLLWQRPNASKSRLERINFPEDQKVPSWSWMAYEGAIEYMEIPPDKVEWCFAPDHLFSAAYGSLSGRPKMTVITKSLTLSQRLAVDRIRLDEDISPPHQDLRCVVLGKDKVANEDGEKTHYVLVIIKDSGKTWRRVGTGWFLGGHLGVDEEKVTLY